MTNNVLQISQRGSTLAQRDRYFKMILDSGLNISK